LKIENLGLQTLGLGRNLQLLLLPASAAFGEATVGLLGQG
jgi:hypothetical protein